MNKLDKYDRLVKKIIIMSVIFSFLTISCRKEDPIIPPTLTVVTAGESGEISGFYLLNEGNMGSNKSTLDYMDFTTGSYYKNIYAYRNPNVVKELGDVGNDIQIYGGKLYAVINCSHFVEVMDSKSAKHITQVSIPNCRYITFNGRYGYVSSYAGPVKIDPNARLGYVAKLDTLTMKVVDTCVVGYQPEDMVIINNKLYVANSGGYRVPNYDNTVSVIDLNTFKEIKKIEVGINLHRMEIDRYGNIWVSSRGDYYDIPSKTFIIDSKTDIVTDTLNLPISNMTLVGDSLYTFSTEWSYKNQTYTISYSIVDVKSKKVITNNYIKDGTDKRIEIPYGIAVHPISKEIYVTDAKDYVTPGTLFCFKADGTLKWKVTTGDIPAHIVFAKDPLSLPKL